jgi:MFS transporter, UMF1 family
VLATAAMALVTPQPSSLALGLVLLAVGTLAFELAQVEYNAMIYQLAPAGRTGRVSGIGWSAGYFGGIVLLAVCLVVFLSDHPLVTVPAPGGSVRVIMLVAAVWFTVFAVPVLLTRPPYPASSSGGEAARVGWLGAYRLLGRRLVALGRSDPHLLGFLVSSAIFRDGLTGVFTFGGVLAVGTFGLSAAQVIVFAIAANVISAVGALVGGWLDDRVGPKIVILVSLAALVVVAAGMLAATGSTAFWIGGLALAAFVGPAQACARSYLARLVPPGREGELFGLYATTGRAASFLAPALFAMFVGLFGAQRWGIAGIGLVLLVGLLSLLPVRPVAGRAGAGEEATAAVTS